ncbi:MAG: protease pro-enzyme activation domain-containing protein, partial [Terracidiphilus sp.]
MISILQSAYPAKFAFASHHVSKRPWKLSKAARSCWLWVALSCTIAFILFSISVQAQRSLMTRHVREATLNRQAQPLGHLPATQAMRLNIVLTLRDEAELNAFLDELYDPASPSYRHFLSVAEFTARFGPTQENYEAVVAFAAAKGLAVVGGTRDGMDVQVEGSVSAIEAAFRINLQTYQHPTENRVFYAPDREPTVDLPFQLWHISGLDNYSIPHTMLVSKSDYAQAHSISPEAVVSHATTGSGPSASFLGSDMRAAYYGGTTLTGAGQNLGLLEFLGTNLADLNTYFTNVGQTNNVPVTLLSTDGTSTTCLYSSGCSDTEQTLDMTQALGMAPGLSSLVMYIGSSDTAIVSAMTTHNPLPTAIGCSWGWTPADPSALDPYFKRMAAQGQNFFAASGDDSTWSSVNEAWPSDDVNVVSVGGTDLITASAGGAWEWETAWLDSGGGISPDGIAIPAWQKLMGVINSSNLGSTTLRNGPDVSANANFTFYTCSNQTTCLANEYGGTSFAAPMWAGYVALLNQQLAANDEPSIGFLNPTIYAQNVTSIYDTDFHDITSGTSGSYSAASGYDLVTGWGSPNGQNLINALAGSPASGFTLSASPSSLSVNPGGTSTTTITINGLAGFTGSVSLAVTSDLPSGVTASFSPNPTTGTSVLTLTASSATAASTYGVTVIGTSGDLAETTGISLTVVNSPEITAPPPTNFGPVGIGTASPSVPSIFTFDKSVTLGSTAVLTQGATGLDFADAGSDTCTANTAYAAGQTCTVNVTFTPKFAGTRYGAVVIYDNNGNAIATGYLQGSGVGPQITFQPGEQSTLGSGFSAPMGVAVDGSSNVYVADSENGAVKEILAVNGSIPVSPIINVLGSGFNTPMGVAVDGNGNVFVADYGASSVYEILRAGDYTTVNKLGDGFSNPRGVAVDGSGNVFVADWGNNAVKEIPLGCVESSCVATLGSGFEYPGGVAVDGSDNVFVIDGGSSTVKEILAAGDYGTVNTLAIGMILASNIAVDGVGNLFVAGQNLDTSIYTVLEIVAAGGYTTADALGGSFSFPYDVAVDGVGNVYVADTSNNRIEKMDYADAPSLNFAGTVVGSTSTDSPQTVTVQNVGNAALSFPIPSSGNNPTIATNFTQNSSGASACPLVSAGSSTAGMLAAGASCQLRISFAPAAAGTLTGSLALTDNNLNAAAPAYTKQSITLSGTGTQATPAITWAAPAAITYSTPLSTTQLNATSTVAGSFTYLPAAGTVLIAGQQTLTATFAPTDATDYTTASATVPLTVIPATATVTLSNLSQTYSGSPITATVTTNPAALAVNVT